jgi:hypothetical protein
MEDSKRDDAPADAGRERGTERPVASGDVLGNFVKRTDDGFRGVKDQNLIGEDVGDDPEEEEDDAPAAGRG